ncbi:MAG: glutathione S-transferase N-terminal domain-containing protein [Burkholderiales bacterium]
MLDFYTAATSNGQRAAIMLEETGLAYTVHKLELPKGDQKKPEFLAINPAGMIPAIVDHDGPGGKPLALSQSAAIVMYLAEKSGKLLPDDAARRAVARQWLMQACADCAGASSAIFLTSNMAPEKTPANVEFFEGRLLRFFRDVDARLNGREFLADEISVADVALYPIYAARKAIADKAGDLPNLARWGALMAARPAVAKGMSV